MTNMYPENDYETLLRKEKLSKLDIVHGMNILDVGCGAGDMWKELIGYINVDGVDTDPNVLSRAVENGLNFYYPEDVNPMYVGTYDVVTMMGLLEHLDSPTQVLEQYSEAKRIFLTVPNANSFHRYVGKEMKLINDLTELGPQDHAIGHKRVYTYNSFLELMWAFCNKFGFKVSQYGTTSFKLTDSAGMIDAFSPEQIDAINKSAELLMFSGEGGAHGAEIYALLEAK